MSASTPVSKSDSNAPRPAAGGITLRPLKLPDDAEAVQAILAAVWQGGTSALMEQQFGPIGGKPWAYWQWQSVEQYLTATNNEAYVAVQAGRVVGFCSCSIDRERSCGEVGYNAVGPDSKGQGVGGLMMNHIMDRIRSLGMTYAVVTVANNDQHVPARRMYEKHGFKPLVNFDCLVQKL